ncbi:MAG TPA: lantibiotic dehydratase C-terminal domain-containing protein [Streptosporangiaceae bacterium]|jgi:hypothetical protein
MNTERPALLVSYYADRKAALIAQSLLPAAEQVAARPGVEVAFLRRHWKGGPHVRLITRGDLVACRAALDQVAPDITGYLAENPSTAQLDEQAYLAISEQLGEAELELGPYAPLRPDNTVQAITLDATDALLEATAMPGREYLLHAARPALAATLSRPGAGEQVYGAPRSLIYRLLVLVAASYPGGIRRGFLSFISHVKEFLLWSDQDGKVERRFATALASQRTTLLGLTEAVLADCVTGDPDPGTYHGHDPLLRQWAGWLSQAWPLGLELAAAELLNPYPDPKRRERAETFGDDIARRWAGRNDRPYSDFHQRHRQLNLEALNLRDEFSAYRLICNVVYELLPLLDVAPIERYFLGYCLSEMAQQVLGDNWQDMIDRGIAKQAAAGIAPQSWDWPA